MFKCLSKLIIVFLISLFSSPAIAEDIVIPTSKEIVGASLPTLMTRWERGTLLEVLNEANDENFDYEKVVLFGEMDFVVLLLQANLESTQRLIDKISPGKTVKSANGYASIKVQAFRAQYVIGCACPPAFTDLLVSVEVEAPEGRANQGGKHVVPIYNLTSHEERKHSFHSKFGSPTIVGTVGWIVDRGFFAIDKFGTEVLRVETKSPLESPRINSRLTIDEGVHTIGGHFDNRDGSTWDITPRFYRKWAQIIIGPADRDFNEENGDQFRVQPGSRLHELLIKSRLDLRVKSIFRASLDPSADAAAKVWLP